MSKNYINWNKVLQAKTIKRQQDSECSSGVECLPSTCVALGSVPRNDTEKIKRQWQIGKLFGTLSYVRFSNTEKAFINQ
jgi:hypothetical protein